MLCPICFGDRPGQWWTLAAIVAGRMAGAVTVEDRGGQAMTPGLPINGSVSHTNRIHAVPNGIPRIAAFRSSM